MVVHMHTSAALSGGGGILQCRLLKDTPNICAATSIVFKTQVLSCGFTGRPVLLPCRQASARDCATNSNADMLQVNEGLSDNPADLLDFSMKQELQQVL